jgi:hypothetical protein
MGVVAAALKGRGDLDWSPAVLCCCKAVEIELERVVLRKWRGRSLALGCKGSGEVEAYLGQTSDKPPGLRLMAHLLRHVARRKIQPVEGLAFEQEGLWCALASLAMAVDGVARLYRNRAVHTQRMTEWDYRFCENMVGGKHGILHMVWGLEASWRSKE